MSEFTSLEEFNEHSVRTRLNAVGIENISHMLSEGSTIRSICDSLNMVSYHLYSWLAEENERRAMFYASFLDASDKLEDEAITIVESLGAEDNKQEFRAKLEKAKMLERKANNRRKLGLKFIDQLHELRIAEIRHAPEPPKLGLGEKLNMFMNERYGTINSLNTNTEDSETNIYQDKANEIMALEPDLL